MQIILYYNVAEFKPTVYYKWYAETFHGLSVFQMWKPLLLTYYRSTELFIVSALSFLLSTLHGINMSDLIACVILSKIIKKNP